MVPGATSMPWALPRRPQAEHGQARLQAFDGDVDGAARLPLLSGEPEAQQVPRFAPGRVPTAAVVLVAELARHPLRRRVVDEGLRVCNLGAEALEGEVQHGCPHLRPDAL